MVWIISTDALAFDKVKELLDSGNEEYYITNQKLSSVWEKVEPEILEVLRTKDYIHSIGLKGEKPDNVIEVSTLKEYQYDLKKYEKVVKNVLRILDRDKLVKKKVKLLRR